MATAELDLDVSVGDELLRKYRNVSVAIERIGPRVARDYMAMNTKNRNLNARHMKRLRSSMLAGEWWMNGETIIFGADGSLLNGQHRLTAVIESGVEIDVLVVRGIDREAFRTLDGGRIRTTGEVLTMDGEKNGNSIAAAVQSLVSFIDCGGNLFDGNRGRKATAILASRVLEAHPNIRNSVWEMRRNTLFKSQHGCLMHYLFWIVSPAKASEFASVLADGHSDIGRPFVLFRETLVRTPIRPDLRRSYAAKAIKAFNAEMSGDRPKMLKFISGEEFPTIHGLNYEKLAESIG